jgi:hypothetical protein
MVKKYYGIGKSGFNVSSCQFAIHYMFGNETTLLNFLQNVAECTHMNGYFIGTCYDGETIFNKLRKTEMDDSLVIKNNVKIWSITKRYDSDNFLPDSSSLGYKISVFQESINNTFDEYLVNFRYLVIMMEHYGFEIISQAEANDLGFRSGSGMFDIIDYRDYNLSVDEKRISFLNRYFIFKKIRGLNAKEVTNSLSSGFVEDEIVQEDEEIPIMEYELENVDAKLLKLSKEAEPEMEIDEPEIIQKALEKAPEVQEEPVIKIKKAPEAQDERICECVKANGKRCTYKAKPGSDFCGLHTDCKNPIQPEAPVPEAPEPEPAPEAAPEPAPEPAPKKTKRVAKVVESKTKKAEKGICECIKANGQRCTYKAKPGSDFCGLHTDCKNPIQENI